MSETTKNNQQEELSAVTSDEDVTNKKRRKVLKTAGVAGGAIAVSQWHKPVLDSVITPAHAQTTTGMSDDDNTGDGADEPDDTVDPTILIGASSAGSDEAGYIDAGQNSNIASKVADMLISSAQATVGDTPESIWSGFVNDVNDYQHCITLTIPGETPPTSVEVSLQGPDIYYDYSFESEMSGYTYYYYSDNFSGSDTVALTAVDDDFEFAAIINEVEVCGTIDSTLTNASGVLLLTNSNGINGFGVDGGEFNFDYSPDALSGYGAYWSITDGGSCSAGDGVAGDVAILDD